MHASVFKAQLSVLILECSELVLAFLRDDFKLDYVVRLFADARLAMLA